jgi:hypothetical protein
MEKRHHRLDSLRPDGTRCFNSHQEFVGVTDWFLTGAFVHNQFKNMDAHANTCKLKFMADPFEDWGVCEAGWRTIKSYAQSVWNFWIATMLDWQARTTT